MAKSAVQVSLRSQPSEPIFVFGADMDGDFSRGSAAIAQRYFNADTTVCSGASGHAYAVPYRDCDGKFLSFGALAPHITAFLSHARANPQQVFMIAHFGCESGGSDITSMVRHFSHLPANCLLPGPWARHLDAKSGVRLLIFDPFARFREPYWQDKLKRYLALNADTCNGAQVEVVSFGGARSLVANDMAAKRLGLKHRVFGPNETFFGKHAELAAEMKAMWYSTHFLSLCDFSQTVQPQQFRVTTAAISAGLVIDQLEVSGAL